MLHHRAAETWQVWQESTKGKEAHFMHWKSWENVTWKFHPFSISTPRCVTVKGILVAGDLSLPDKVWMDLGDFGGFFWW